MMSNITKDREEKAVALTASQSVHIGIHKHIHSITDTRIVNYRWSKNVHCAFRIAYLLRVAIAIFIKFSSHFVYKYRLWFYEKL